MFGAVRLRFTICWSHMNKLNNIYLDNNNNNNNNNNINMSDGELTKLAAVAECLLAAKAGDFAALDTRCATHSDSDSDGGHTPVPVWEGGVRLPFPPGDLRTPGGGGRQGGGGRGGGGGGGAGGAGCLGA
eukprot:GHVU01049521.1.p1 GENE.GHVU01049521.1~~GHVU01049521.1.p1  ORF type:complete len:130 (-),score=21.01 GHVU01049521.1:25-414(-)